MVAGKMLLALIVENRLAPPVIGVSAADFPILQLYSMARANNIYLL